ncbi:hypothetical protein BJM39_10550 [Salmonella enterica subsp. enterica serovar Javiana]|nr:hypothetical protein BJM39_10550 [Salmonella enterica subsp. enterica serovar Javiana]
MKDGEITPIMALGHTTRLTILSLLTGSELSASDVARELGLTQANASYHLRYLLAAGLVEECAPVVIRGGAARRYRHPWRQGSHADPQVSHEDRAAWVAAFASLMIHRFESYESHRGSSNGSFTDAELWVEPHVWSRAVSLLDEASALLHASAKPPRSKGTIRASLNVAAFRMRRTS